MATKRIVQLPTVSGWTGTAGGSFTAHTITVSIPKGPRYHDLWISAHPGTGKFLLDTNGSNGLVKEIRLKVNGKVQRIATADEINRINVMNGLNYACKNGLIVPASWTVATEVPALCIFLAEPWREDEDAQDGLRDHLMSAAMVSNSNCHRPSAFWSNRMDGHSIVRQNDRRS